MPVASHSKKLAEIFKINAFNMYYGDDFKIINKNHSFKVVSDLK
ncbi:hypothetical protein E9M_04816 [Moraxella catarrhalis 46P47B1]|nr:hypothetical protein E9M_04816 [Moraxella catarrhalis 46P47B1]